MGGSPAGAKPPAAAPAPNARETAPATPPPDAGEHVRRLPVGQIKPCALQPRKDFGEESLRELADSIREQGVLQPLVVRPRNGEFELIAGERRWRAAQMAGLTEVPVLVREADDRKVLELALIENLQRENLNPIEEALGYSKLISDFQLKQEEAAARVGKNRSTVTNLLRLLQLPADVQNYLRASLLTLGHAKAILGCASAESQKQLAEQVIREGLSVRATEELVASRVAHQPGSNGAATATPSRPASTPDVHVADLQNRLQQKFGTKVFVRYRKGKGAVEIRFFNDEDLDRILDIVGVKPE